MKIHLHIDRLILDGVPAEEPQVLRRAFEAELTRRLGDDGLARRFQARAAVPRVPGGNMRVTHRADAAQLGRQIARAVHHGIGGNR